LQKSKGENSGLGVDPKRGNNEKRVKIKRKTAFKASLGENSPIPKKGPQMIKKKGISEGTFV